MTLARILTAAGAAALLGGTAMAQAVNDERPKDVVGNTPAASTDMNVQTNVMPMAPSATESAMPASTIAPDNAPGTITTRLITNGPVPDTPENRAMYKPLSRAGKATDAKGN